MDLMKNKGHCNCDNGEAIILNGMFKKLEKTSKKTSSKNSENFKPLLDVDKKLSSHKCNTPLLKPTEESNIIQNSTNKKQCGCKQCKPDKNNKPGNFVPIINNNIDLASSTYVNNPIIPCEKPPEVELKDKKYQVIIGFDNDIKGKIWPDWMKEPVLHALGRIDISSEIKEYADTNIIPLIDGNTVKIAELSTSIDDKDKKITIISGYISNNVMPLIKRNSIKINELSNSLNKTNTAISNVNSNVTILSGFVHNTVVPLISSNTIMIQELSVSTNEISISLENTDKKVTLISNYISETLTPIIFNIDNRVNTISVNVNEISGNVNTLSTKFNKFIETPATISSLGLVKSSDKINQISVLEDGIMEINGMGLSRLSQDCELRLWNPSIAESDY